MNIAGCILAGGKSIRMGGRPKAFIEINGETIINTTLKTFKSLFDEIIIVTNTPYLFDRYQADCKIVYDIIKHIGPLGAIHAGLSTTTKEAVFFAACDMPNLHNETIMHQIDFFEKTGFQVCVAKMGKFIEPLHAIYKKELEQEISNYVEKNENYSLQAFLKTVETGYFRLKTESFNKEIFKNINTPDDLNS